MEESALGRMSCPTPSNMEAKLNALFYILLCIKEYKNIYCCCLVAKLCPSGLKHTRLSCPSLSSGVCSNSRPLNQ